MIVRLEGNPYHFYLCFLNHIYASPSYFYDLQLHVFCFHHCHIPNPDQVKKMTSFHHCHPRTDLSNNNRFMTLLLKLSFTYLQWTNPKANEWRRRGRVVNTLDLWSDGPGFNSSSLLHTGFVLGARVRLLGFALYYQ